MTLLSVNGHDYTKNIVVPSWSVSDTEVFKTWTDALGTSHRDVLRTKVIGQFNFKSRGTDDADFASFIDDLAAVRTAANAYTITVYMDNTATTKTIDAYVTFTPAMTRVGGGPVYVDAFAVRIEEV